MLSEIRHSQINALLEKVKKNQYDRYLKTVKIGKARSFKDVQVTFDFPVTALIGPNGGGKSTILGAAACCYKEIKPSVFFPKSSIGDNTMSEWKIEYDAIDRSRNHAALIQRRSVFRQLKWNREDVISRSDLAYFRITRTIPASERTIFRKLKQKNYKHKAPLEFIPSSAAKEIEHILGKKVSEFQRTKIGPTSTFHVGRNGDIEYSEFHFGAGESSIIRIVTEIEGLPENSLILIEEIENGLHPVATRRLVEYLIAAAEKRKIQAIFTTHSDDAISVLPGEGVWACLNGRVQQGKLSIAALRAITGKIDTALAIFTEDAFAEFIVKALVREFCPECFDQIAVHSVAGDGNAVGVHKSHKVNPAVSVKSLCVLDGDSRQTHDEAQNIFRLPGAQPEAAVFDHVLTDLTKKAALLTISMQQGAEKQANVVAVTKSLAMTNRDRHLIFNQLGIDLGFISEEIVQGAFVNLWLRDKEPEFRELVNRIKSLVGH